MKNELIKYSFDQLTKLDLINSTVEYLTRFGLPAAEILLVKFSPVLTTVEGKPHLVQIGIEADLNPVCISRNSGEVVVIDQAGNSERFINSDISAFVRCLLEFEKYKVLRNAIAGNSDYLDEAVNLEIVERFQNKIFDIDPALRHAEYFWPVVVEQMENQML